MTVDVASIVFAAVCANHLGLVGAIEKILRAKLPIANCAKCLSFWCVMAYCLMGGVSVIHALATSFLASYAAIWAELLMGLTDRLYEHIYDKIYSTEGAADISHPTDGDASNPTSTMP